MRLLLDTHVAIWSVSAPERLSSEVFNLIAEPEHSVSISMATLWEIAIKNGPGRAPRNPIGLTVEQAHQAFIDAEFAILPIQPRHLSAVERLPHLHRDPFDRLLVATAKAETSRLVTHDRMLAAYGDDVIVI